MNAGSDMQGKITSALQSSNLSGVSVNATDSSVELTGNVALVGPLLAATGAAYAVTVLLLKRSILTEKIARRGQHIVRE